jgi:hypothetical protein
MTFDLRHVLGVGGVLALLSSGAAEHAFAHGMFAEFLPPKSIEGRDLGLFVQMLPNYILEGTRSNVSLQLRLYEDQSNANVANVTYVVYVGRFNSSASLGVDFVLLDMFYSRVGPLNINIIPADAESIQVDAPRSPYTEAWVADETTGSIDYRTPVIFHGGLYYVGVVIAGIDRADSFLDPESAPLFEAGLSIGYALQDRVRYADRINDITIVSFYDKITSFRYNESNHTFSWSMPFDWELEKLGNQSMFVHQEVKIPKVQGNLNQVTSVDGSINGIKIGPRNISVDPYSSEEYVTFHYILGKSDVIALDQDIGAGIDEMRFTLSPSSGNITELVEDMTQDTIFMTESGGIQIIFNLNQTLQAGTSSEATIQFYDSLYMKSIDADVIYDLTLRDKLGNELISLNNQTATNGVDTQGITFPSNDVYYVEIKVRGLMSSGQAHDAEQSSGSLDTSRAGVARTTIVVVPEFPIPVLTVALILAGMTIVLRLSRLPQSRQ